MTTRKAKVKGLPSLFIPSHHPPTQTCGSPSRPPTHDNWWKAWGLRAPLSGHLLLPFHHSLSKQPGRSLLPLSRQGLKDTEKSPEDALWG